MEDGDNWDTREYKFKVILRKLNELNEKVEEKINLQILT